LTILINVLDLSLYRSLLLFEFLTNIKILIVAYYFTLFEFLKYIQKYLFKVKCSRKNYREKLIYNIYKTRQTLKFAIEIIEISIIIRQKLKQK